MTVRINKQKINLREKLTEFEDKVNFDEVVRGLGEYTGNVGIGTTDPVNVLHVHGEVDGLGYIRITDGSTGSTATDGARIGYNALGLRIQNYENTNISFFTNNSTQALTIKNDGNVGIGTTNPGTNKLYVNGNIYASGTITPSSDDRVKHNEQNIVGAIETIGKLTPKKYIKTTEMYEADHNFELDENGNPVDADGEPVEHTVEAGVIAQQVLTVDELAFMVSPEGVDEDGNVTSPHGLNYNSLFTYAIAAIQEQQSIIEDLKSRIETLESK